MTQSKYTDRLPQLLTTQEVAKYLQISTRTLETMIAMGQIKPLRVGGGSKRCGQRRFSVREIERYLERLERAA